MMGLTLDMKLRLEVPESVIFAAQEDEGISRQEVISRIFDMLSDTSIYSSLGSVEQVDIKVINDER